MPNIIKTEALLIFNTKLSLQVLEKQQISFALSETVSFNYLFCLFSLKLNNNYFLKTKLGLTGAKKSKFSNSDSDIEVIFIIIIIIIIIIIVIIIIIIIIIMN